MLTKLAIDDALLEQARKLGNHRTRRESVWAALEDYVGRPKQQELLALFGTIEYQQGYDYKHERRSKPNVNVLR